MSARDVISFELDGKPVDAIPGETILQAAKRSGVEIPHLCYKEGMRADGNCRACAELLPIPERWYESESEK
jgi:formate dehydrogenase major subunit